MADDAWERFCEDLKRAGRVLERDLPARDERTRAEGLRHLVRMVRLAFEVTGEYGDPRHPALFPMAGPTLLSEGVTGDARYLQAFIDGTARHRITGERGEAPLMEIGVYRGRAGFHPDTTLTACLTEKELRIDAGGRFEVLFGPEPQPGNWIETGPDTRYLFIRQYAHDWTRTRAAALSLERLDVSGPPPPLGLDAVRSALERTAAYVHDGPAFWADISDYWAANVVNRIVSQEGADEKTDVAVPSGHRFACGYFRLEPDEALVVDFQPVTAPYWGIHLDNYWYETLSWEGTRAQLNDRTVRYRHDGSVRLVVSERRPGEEPNWLETQGHREGSVVFRLSRSDEPMPEFATKVVPVAELAAG